MKVRLFSKLIITYKQMEVQERQLLSCQKEKVAPKVDQKLIIKVNK